VRPNRLLRSTGFRMALLYAALFAFSSLVLFGVLYWQTAGYIERQIRDIINAESQSLTARYQHGGLAELQTAIRHRLSGRSRASLYLLRDPQGSVLESNLPTISVAQGWAEFRAPGNDDETGDRQDGAGDLVVGRGTRLTDGSFLFVGQNPHQLEEIRELLVDAFVWALGAMLVLAAMGGAVVGAGALRRVDAINRVAGEIVQGDLPRRIPLRGTNDELDVLSHHLNQMLDRIQSLMEGMRQVTNDIAHDLRTPLGRLRQRLEGARREAATITEYQHSVEQAIDETDEILETFGALLRIAQIESGSRRARFRTVDLRKVMDTVVEAYVPIAEESGHDLCGELPAGVTVQGDRELLMQLFANLIDDALQHTPPGSRIELSLNDTRGRPVATVCDTGPGIPEGARTKVLQRFYRLEASRSTPGSGLGLSLVAAIVDLHSIELHLGDNQPGLCVRLDFPERGKALL
jgi:signal transduction histidine kinase